MSSVLDAIKRMFGRDHSTQPDSEAASVATTSTQAAATEPAIRPTAEEPAVATPEEEAERPIQSTAPPLTSMPSAAAAPPASEAPAEASSVAQSMEAEPATESAGPQVGISDELLGTAIAQDSPTSYAGVDEAVRSNTGEEVLPVAEQVTAIKETDVAIVGGQKADFEEQGQALAAEQLSPSEYAARPQPLRPPLSPEPPEPLRTDTAVQPARPEESPEPPMRAKPWITELESESESWAPDENH